MHFVFFDVLSVDRSVLSDTTTQQIQELEKFNRLIDTMKSSLSEVQRAIRGEVVMSMELEQMGRSMTNGQVPAMWANVAYPSLKPLGSWVSDLMMRLMFFDQWIEGGVPKIFWISAFIFTQAFLTGTRQNFARNHQIAIDLVGWDFKTLTTKETEAITQRAVDGAYVNGMFLDGARWDPENMVLAESRCVLALILCQSRPCGRSLSLSDARVPACAHVHACARRGEWPLDEHGGWRSATTCCG